MNHHFISSELLDKYLNHQCTAEEVRKVETWYASRKGEKHFLASLSDLDRQLLEDDILKKIKHTIDIPDEDQYETPRKWSFWRSRMVQLAMAASFLLACMGSWFFFQERIPVQTNDDLFGIVEPVKGDVLTRFVNTKSKLVTHRLSDGTEVCLHPNAELTYPKVFSGKIRQVTFLGEGFFDVAHDSIYPFVIQSDKMQIRVLGTKFNVKALPQQAIFQVSVLSGSVAVRSALKGGRQKSEVIILKPRQKVLFEVATSQLTTLEIPGKVKKEIYEPVSIDFDDTPVSEVILQLQKQFNIQIELSDKSLEKCLLTADFEHQPLPVILEIMCVSLDINYTFSGDTLILKGNGCE